MGPTKVWGNCPRMQHWQEMYIALIVREMTRDDTAQLAAQVRCGNHSKFLPLMNKLSLVTQHLYTSYIDLTPLFCIIPGIVSQLFTEFQVLQKVNPNRISLIKNFLTVNIKWEEGRCSETHPEMCTLL